MIYPNITDEETRRVAAKTLRNWHKNFVAEVRYAKQKDNLITAGALYRQALVIKEWIYGFRRALEIVNDP
jgi:hypothetical protein